MSFVCEVVLSCGKGWVVTIQLRVDVLLDSGRAGSCVGELV